MRVCTLPGRKVLDGAFGAVWERDVHIRLVRASAKRFAHSGRRQASHVLLYGPPASAKTSLFKTSLFKASAERSCSFRFS
jgi:hypothetical protein